MLSIPGDYELSLEHKGKRRSYIVHVPPQAFVQQTSELSSAELQTISLPLILNLHGGGGNARGYMQYTCMNDYADEAGFLVVYPNGSGERHDKFLSWNAGSCCGYAYEHQCDDVGFIKTLLQVLPDRISYDMNRVYATGISNGAMMAYRLASELSDKIAAIAAVAGGAVFERNLADRAVPVLHIHSVDDTRALFKGGLGPRFPMTDIRVNHPNIENVIRLWVEHNNCSLIPEVEPAIIKHSGDINHSATRYCYSSSLLTESGKNVEVVLWKLTGAGHVWPGGMQDYMESFLGQSTDVIDANKEIWKFFSGYSL